MKKSGLKAVFINAKSVDSKYIALKIKTDGNSQPEIIINPRENFNAKYDYYMQAYDDDLVMIATKGKKDIRITGAAHGNSFDDIQWNLTEKGIGWRKLLSDKIEKAYNNMILRTPPKDEYECIQCETIKEAIKGMFINESKTATEARFIEENIEQYEEIFDISMNGDDMAFRKGIVNLQKMQNEFLLKSEEK